MRLYEFIVKDKSGNIIDSLEGAKNRWFEIFLNKPGAAGFTVSIYDSRVNANLLQLSQKELFIYRAGVLVWGGELTTRRISLPEEDHSVSLTAKGFFDLLKKRYAGTAASPRVFNNTDAGQIAWTLINESQQQTDGDFGITQGTIQASVNRSVSYEYKNIKEAIEELSSLNLDDGYDFEISPDKKFSVFYPRKGRDRNDIVFEWGVNIADFFEDTNTDEMANRVIVLGEGQGSEMATVTVNSTARIQQSYKIREAIVMKKDESDTAVLTDLADKERIKREVVDQVVSIKVKGDMQPSFGSYTIGDSVKVKIKEGFLDIDQLLRIYGIKVRINEEDEEDIELVFNRP